ncbi:VOC family protein [Nocardioides zeae]
MAERGGLLGGRQVAPHPDLVHATDVQEIHDALAADGHVIVSAPIDGPFGRTSTFVDPDGYHLTLHDRA